MITISVSFNRETREASLRLKGHAGQAEAGKDIVCASASILAYTVAQIVNAMSYHKDFSEPPIIKLEEGDAAVVCRAKDDDIYGEALRTYFVALTGYRLLATSYPQYVELIIDDEDI